MNSGPETPFRQEKVSTLPRLEYGGQLPPPSRAASTDLVGGPFTFPCRSSRDIHLFSTRTSEGSFRRSPRFSFRPDVRSGRIADR